MSVPNNQTSKAFPYSSFIPFYVNGLGIFNDATTPDSLLDVAAGSCLDSTGTFQISLGSTAVINSAVNGINGLDTGTIADNKVYAVYLVCDVVQSNPAGCMISLNYPTSNVAAYPYLPYGYNAYRLIGYVATDSSGYFLKGYWSDNDTSRRQFTYDAFQETAITAGSATSYAAVNLTKWVPLVNNLSCSIYTNFSAASAGDSLSLQAGNATGAQQIIIAPVAGSTAHTTTISNVLAQTTSISSVLSPTINYEVSSGSDAVAIYVAGYVFDL